jgi:hypothetical protein
MRSAPAILFTLAATAGAQKGPPIRLLDAPSARSTVMVGSPAAVRQLRDGRLLVNDTQRRQLVLLDAALGTATIIADSAAGRPNSYGAKAGAIIPFLADSTLFVDPDGLSMFVIDPAGKIARVASVPRSQDAGSLGSNTSNSPGMDTKGRLVYRGLSRVKQVANGGLTIAQFPDSIDIDRIDLATRRVDTIGYVKVQKMNMSITQTERGMTVGGEINPVQNVDDWTVLSDGTIAIVRGLDYHVDLIGADGAARSAAKIPFTWRPLTDDEKVVVLDSAKRALDRMFAGGGAAAAAAMHGGAMPPGVAPSGAGGAQPPMKVVGPSALPDYWPPFGQGAARADADGHLWVRTSATRPEVIGGPIYDVIDRSGSLIDRVQLASGRRIVGFGPGGVVYLAAADPGGTRIERTTMASNANAHASADTTATRFVGVWEGSYQSNHAPPGAMTLTIARDSSWKVQLELLQGTNVIPTQLRNFKAVGNDVEWTLEVMGMSCPSGATLEAGLLKGQLECGQAVLTFSLKKR